MKQLQLVVVRILQSAGVILALILLYQLVILLATPLYRFPEPKPFSGAHLFNPYQGIDSTCWRKTNFHYHTKAWMGLTSGRDNTYEAFYETYMKLGYDAPQISNYQSIDTRFSDSAFYVPAYEHGFGLRKKHQLLIGAREVLWFDYSLLQTRHQKQHILDLLRPDNDIVAIAHPDWEGGYSCSDMAVLTNYDLVEALNHNWRSIPHWDAALSAGRPVFILAGDDAHDITDPYEIQRICTYINTPVSRSDSLVNALREGKAFGAEIYMGDWENFDDKARNAKTIPVVNHVRVAGDTLKVSVTGQPFKIVFIGQNGKVRKITRFSREAWYRFKPEDTYIRTEIIFLTNFAFPKVGPGTVFYLNPVFRTDGLKPVNARLATVDLTATWVLRIAGFGLVAGLLAGVAFYLKRRGGRHDV